MPALFKIAPRWFNTELLRFKLELFRFNAGLPRFKAVNKLLLQSSPVCEKNCHSPMGFGERYSVVSSDDAPFWRRDRRVPTGDKPKTTIGMANFDSGETYDSGVLYAGAVPPTPTKPMTKFKVKLDLRRKTDLELKEFAQQHITKATGNPDFTTLDPDAATFLAGSNGFASALADSDAAQQTAKQKTAAKDAARGVLESLLTDRGSYVERKSGGDKAKILSIGFDVKGEGAPSGVPDRVGNLSISTGDNAGELDAHWDAVDGGKITYEIHSSPDPVTQSSWNNQPRSTKSKTTLAGLTSGARTWVRVRATGSGGAGAWSDPVSKIVP